MLQNLSSVSVVIGALIFHILMDFPIQIATIRMELSIIYFKGSQVDISK